MVEEVPGMEEEVGHRRMRNHWEIESLMTGLACVGGADHRRSGSDGIHPSSARHSSLWEIHECAWQEATSWSAYSQCCVWIIDEVGHCDERMVESFSGVDAAVCTQHQHLLQEIEKLTSVGFFRHHIRTLIQRNIHLEYILLVCESSDMMVEAYVQRKKIFECAQASTHF